MCPLLGLVYRVKVMSAGIRGASGTENERTDRLTWGKRKLHAASAGAADVPSKRVCALPAPALEPEAPGPEAPEPGAVDPDDLRGDDTDSDGSSSDDDDDSSSSSSSASSSSCKKKKKKTKRGKKSKKHSDKKKSKKQQKKREEAGRKKRAAKEAQQALARRAREMDRLHKKDVAASERAVKVDGAKAAVMIKKGRAHLAALEKAIATPATLYIPTLITDVVKSKMEECRTYIEQCALVEDDPASFKSDTIKEVDWKAVKRAEKLLTTTSLALTKAGC